MKNFLKNAIIIIVLIISAYSIFQFRYARREASAQTAVGLPGPVQGVPSDRMFGDSSVRGTPADRMAGYAPVRDTGNVMRQLEQEKAMRLELSEENIMLKDYLRASKRRLAKLFGEFRTLEKEVMDRDARLNVMTSQITRLEQDRETLAQENESMKFRLGSIQELKKAIREVKIKVREAARELREKLRIDTMVWGNAGFLVKDGQNTFKSPGVKIEVTPASQQVK